MELEDVELEILVDTLRGQIKTLEWLARGTKQVGPREKALYRIKKLNGILTKCQEQLNRPQQRSIF